MYQLTGEEPWLRRTMNSLGSCVQLIDGETGILRHSFTQDPYVETSKLIEDQAYPDNNGKTLSMVCLFAGALSASPA